MTFINLLYFYFNDIAIMIIQIISLLWSRIFQYADK